MTQFSIVIPTKNRAELVRDAVQHSLSMTFRDFEIVVVDNDDTEATSLALESIEDERLHVLRTGGLAMAENWEEGFKAASGDYIYMQSDRLRLRPGILEHLAARINTHHPQVLKCIQGAPTKHLASLTYEDEWSILDPSWIIRFILDTDFAAMYNFIPNGYSSFYSREFVHSIQAEIGRMACRITPDFTAAYATLFRAEAVHHTTRHPFSMVSSTSTGISFQYGGELGVSTLSHMGITIEDVIKDAKIPVTSIPTNTIFSDFFAMSKKMGQPYVPEDMDSIKHVKFIFRQLMQSRYYYHLDVSDDLRMVYNFLENHDLMGHPKIKCLFEEYNFLRSPRFTKLSFLEIWKALANAATSVAVYGVTDFSAWLEQALDDSPHPEIVAVLDNRGPNAPNRFGKTPISPEQFDPTTCDCILVASDVPSEVAAILDSCRRHYGSKIKLFFVDSDLTAVSLQQTTS